MKPAKSMNSTEIVAELNSNSLRDQIRKLIYYGMAAIEQAQQQRSTISPVEVRRREFDIAEKVIQLLINNITTTTNGKLSLNTKMLESLLPE